MIAWDWLGLYAVIGDLAGLGAGLFGVSSGAIMTPALLLRFRSAGVPEELAIYMAVAASLATIIFTQSSSALGRWRREAGAASQLPLRRRFSPWLRACCWGMPDAVIVRRFSPWLRACCRGMPGAAPPGAGTFA